MKRFRAFVLCCTVVVVGGSTAWAQGTAQISGVVKDESGAVLPGVTVTLTQTATGYTRTVVTEAGGEYTMPNLPTGPYRLEAMLQGFRTYSRTGIVLQVGASPVVNIALALGGLEESVTVEGAAPLVDVKSAGISDVVDQEKIVELPLEGRQVTSLLVISGAAVNRGTVAAQRNRRDSVAISVAGGLPTSVTYTLDGALHNDNYDNLNLSFPFPDALQEFQVATGGLSAENGMHSGAAVNAVTKSGTNQFSGTAFEFARDHRFNSIDPFAAIGPDGKRADDGLNRNQYGGVIGGPLVKDKLFFFGGFQGTRTRQIPASTIAWVPTPAMLAGDFTTRMSAECNNGTARAPLRAPYVNNRLDPSLISPIALAISKRLPSSTDPCGKITYSIPSDRNDNQGVARLDYHISTSQSVFVRYLDTTEHFLSPLEKTGNPLTVIPASVPKRLREYATAFGHTLVLGSNSVNAVHATFVNGGTHLNDPPVQFFDSPSVGINLYTYVPGTSALTISDAFRFGGGSTVKYTLAKRAYQVDDQFTMVRGSHQFAFGGNTAYWFVQSTDYGSSTGNLVIQGRQTGLGLADFIAGRLDQLTMGAPASVDQSMWYLGLYGQDAWKPTSRLTFNLGLRWEPYFGQVLRNGAQVGWSHDNFVKGIVSTQFKNAPPGLLFPGDPGYNNKGMNTQWWNMSPRLGLAWDVSGDGRTAIRSSYAMNYDFPSGQFMYEAAVGTPFSNRVQLSGTLSLADPWANYPGGNPFPSAQPPTVNAAFPADAPFQVFDSNINAPRIQSWNVTAEKQMGTVWMASVSYLGSYIDRLWGNVQLNPGIFMGLGPCTIAGVNYATCTTTNNLHARRLLSLESPVSSAGIGYLAEVDDVGTQTYRGLKLSIGRRAAKGLSLTGNYTLSHCEADTYFDGHWPNYNQTYQDSSNPSFDRGNCLQTVRQVGNVSASAQTPRFTNRMLNAVASDWRASGVFNARSGNWLNITVNNDVAFNGNTFQRPDQISNDVYGAKTIDSYLNKAAFAASAPGALGNTPAASIEGPGYWNVDLGISRLLNLGTAKTLELRVEAFNIFNHYNYADPNAVWDTATFGLITALNGTPRVMQFGIKYGF